MSSEAQLKGDSLRRQLEASERFAREHDLLIVDHIGGVPLRDLGISAFKGKNAQSGALSFFLNALIKGDVEPNSVLLIESLDRISRDRVTSAFPQFLSIVNGGVEIITISDGQRYNKQKIDAEPMSLFVSLSAMVRANEESEIKSQRVRAAWVNKRQNSKTKVLTKLCPGWLQYSEQTSKFQLIPGRDEIVRLIFDMCINTGGLYAIAGHLNQQSVPTFGSGKLWYRSYIKKVLTNRAVLGETQPHAMVDGKRQKSGEPVRDYFPRLIDENTFILAQAAISRRTIVGKGRKGSTFGNVFMGIIYCGNCKSRMSLRNHGGDQTYSKSLICVNKRHKAGCTNEEWNISELEKLLFPHFREINFATLTEESGYAQGLSLASQSEILKEMLVRKERDINELMSSVTSLGLNPPVRERFTVRINALQEAIEQDKADIVELQKKASEEQLLKDDATQQRFKVLLEKIELERDDYLFRSSINQLLIRFIERIELRQPIEEVIPWELDENSSSVKSFRNRSSSKASMPLEDVVVSKEFAQFFKKYHRQISIKYKSGAVRHILWGEDASFGSSRSALGKTFTSINL